MDEVQIKVKRLTKPQLEIKQAVDTRKRFTVAMCGRRFGKSELAQHLIIERLFPNQNIIGYICPTFDLCRKFYDVVVSRIPSSLIASSNRTELQLTTMNGSILKFFSGLEPDRLRGWSLDFLVLDEASFIDQLEDKWYNVYRVVLADRKGKALFISTPRSLSFFTAAFNWGCDTSSDEWQSFRYTTYDNPHIPIDEIDSMKRTMPKAKFEQEILAIPMANQDAVFASNHIMSCTHDELSIKQPIVFGVDLAKKHDYSVIVGLDADNNMCYFERFQLPWIPTKQRILSVKQQYTDVPMYLDSTGVGNPILEDLQSEIHGIYGHQFTPQNKPKMVYALQNKIETGQIRYNQITANELSTFEYKLSSSGQPQFNAISGYFDDTISALMIASWYREQAIADTNWSLHFA
jgi:hypothetical protein